MRLTVSLPCALLVASLPALAAAEATWRGRPLSSWVDESEDLHRSGALADPEAAALSKELEVRATGSEMLEPSKLDEERLRKLAVTACGEGDEADAAGAALEEAGPLAEAALPELSLCVTRVPAWDSDDARARALGRIAGPARLAQWLGSAEPRERALARRAIPASAYRVFEGEAYVPDGGEAITAAHGAEILSPSAERREAAAALMLALGGSRDEFLPAIVAAIRSKDAGVSAQGRSVLLALAANGGTWARGWDALTVRELLSDATTRSAALELMATRSVPCDAESHALLLRLAAEVSGQDLRHATMALVRQAGVSREHALAAARTGLKDPGAAEAMRHLIRTAGCLTDADVAELLGLPRPPDADPREIRLTVGLQACGCPSVP